MIVPEGKKVFFRGKTYKAGDELPSVYKSKSLQQNEIKKNIDNDKKEKEKK